jgi:hypothetical protein
MATPTLAPAFPLSWIAGWTHVALCSFLNLFLMLTLHLDEVQGFWHTTLLPGVSLLALEHVLSALLIAYVLLDAFRTAAERPFGRLSSRVGAGGTLALLAANDLLFWRWPLAMGLSG